MTGRKPQATSLKLGRQTCQFLVTTWVLIVEMLNIEYFPYEPGVSHTQAYSLKLEAFLLR